MRGDVWHHVFMKALIVAIAVSAVVTLGIVVARNRPSADQAAVDYRQALMTVIDGVSEPLFLMQSGRLAYDGALIRRHAAELPVLSGMVPEDFGRDTRAASRVATAALPYVWSDAADFGKAAQAFESAAAELQAAVQAGDRVRVLQAVQRLDGACTRCHRRFRAP
jgi:cytochrome c556